MNIMKHIKIAILVAVCLFAASCEEGFYEQYPSNSITEGNFYRNDNDFNQAVGCCYLKLKTQMGWFLSETAYRSDECCLLSMTTSTQDRYDIDHFQESSSTSMLEDIWSAWYNGIYRCNDILDHLEGKESSLANGDKYKGEALFLRSWWYFNLYRTFGVVPIATDVVTPAAAKTIARCTESEMYDRLNLDLTEAIADLPSSRSAEVARVTKIAAQALLAKVDLTFGKYAEAKTLLESALADPNFGMMSTTGKAFDVNEKMNKEIIFAIYYNKADDNGHGAWYSSSTIVMSDILNPTTTIKSLYDAANDNRLALINTYTKSTTTNNQYFMTKWYDTFDPVYTTEQGNDFPLIRYADVILMYAEALAQTSDLPGAIDQLNRTRNRAGLVSLSDTDIATKTAFIQALADERGREFALEGQRWYDLVRLGLAVDYFKALGYTLDSHNLVFPIPQAEIEIVNNKSILWQNPGY